MLTKAGLDKVGREYLQRIADSIALLTLRPGDHRDIPVGDAILNTTLTTYGKTTYWIIGVSSREGWIRALNGKNIVIRRCCEENDAGIGFFDPNLKATIEVADTFSLYKLVLMI